MITPHSKVTHASAVRPRTVRELLAAAAQARPIGSRFVRVKPTSAGSLIHVLPPNEEETEEITLLAQSLRAVEPVAAFGDEVSVIASAESDGNAEVNSGSAESDESTASGSDSSDSSSSSSSSSKMAIVGINAGSEWVAWHCAERPEAIFEDVIDVPVRRRYDGRIRGWLRLAREWVQAVEATEVISAMALGAPTEVTAEALWLGPDSVYLYAEASEPRIAWPGCDVTAVRVRVAGRRYGSPERWRRHTAQEAASNDAFYRAALQEIL